MKDTRDTQKPVYYKIDKDHVVTELLKSDFHDNSIPDTISTFTTYGKDFITHPLSMATSKCLELIDDYIKTIISPALLYLQIDKRGNITELDVLIYNRTNIDSSIYIYTHISTKSLCPTTITIPSLKRLVDAYLDAKKQPHLGVDVSGMICKCESYDYNPKTMRKCDFMGMQLIWSRDVPSENVLRLMTKYIELRDGPSAIRSPEFKIGAINILRDEGGISGPLCVSCLGKTTNDGISNICIDANCSSIIDTLELQYGDKCLVRDAGAIDWKTRFFLAKVKDRFLVTQEIQNIDDFETINSSGIIWDECQPISPKPKYIPFTQETFRPHRDKWFKHIDSNSELQPIRLVNEKIIGWGLSNYLYSDALKYLTFEDGSPCGTEVKS